MTFMPLQPGQSPAGALNPQQMLALLGNHAGLGAGPMGPMSAPPIPGVAPAGGQGVSTPGMLPQQILSLMAQPKLQGKVR